MYKRVRKILKSIYLMDANNIFTCINLKYFSSKKLYTHTFS